MIAVETSWYSFETNVNSIFIACIVAVTISGIALNVKYDVTTYKSKLILLTFTFMIMSCLLFLLSHFFDTFVLRKLYSIGGFFLSCGYIAQMSMCLVEYKFLWTILIFFIIVWVV